MIGGVSISMVMEDAVALLEEVLEFEDMDPEQCSALPGFTLCGSRWCEACGCLTDKLARVRAAQAGVTRMGGDSLLAPVSEAN